MAVKRKLKKKKLKSPPKRKHEIININGEINEEVYVDFCQKMSEFEARKNVKSVKVIINTDGGSYYDGMAIASRIGSSPLKVICQIYGRAFSAGSVIAVAGQEVYMSYHAKIMVHELITGVYGNTTQIFRMTLQLLQEQKEWCEYMSNNTPVPADQWEEWLLQEKYIGAEEALDLGIIDGIV